MKHFIGLLTVLTFTIFPASMHASPDFGNDSSTWARDGECDDPRFSGPGMASTLVESDRKADATDCQAAFNDGQIALQHSDLPDFGDDTGSWVKDGECDDPRFEGPGMASTLVDADLQADATDCRQAWNTGQIVLSTSALPDFGDDSGRWANDGVCDDSRFSGPARQDAAITSDSHHSKDASDCRTAWNNGQLSMPVAAAPPNKANKGTPPLGDDSGTFSNDGECDDARFSEEGDNSSYMREHVLRDATDCRQAFISGQVSLSLDFGDDSGRWANDGVCDDSRFSGSARQDAAITSDSHHSKDASDCIAAYRDGTLNRY